VDGFEVWTPQSQRYTDFLIDSLDRRNRKAGRGERRQLIFMGDDTHMSEKLRPEKAAQDMADPTGMAGREIGVQSAWDDLAVRKKLLASGMSRESVIEEYTARLAS